MVTLVTSLGATSLPVAFTAVVGDRVRNHLHAAEATAPVPPFVDQPPRDRLQVWETGHLWRDLMSFHHLISHHTIVRLRSPVELELPRNSTLR